MNAEIDRFARDLLLSRLTALPEDYQRTFRLMYARNGGKRSTAEACAMSLAEVVAGAPFDKITWAIQQCEASAKKLGIATSTSAQAAQPVAPTLFGFPREDLEAIADGLETGYEKTINVGEDVPEAESTTSAAARFIRAALAVQPVAADTGAAASDPKSLHAGWFLPVSAVNGLQAASIDTIIRSAKRAHTTNAVVRKDGKEVLHEADWIKHMERING